MTSKIRPLRDAETENAVMIFIAQAAILLFTWPDESADLRQFAFGQIGTTLTFFVVLLWRYRNRHKHTHRPFVWAILHSLVFALTTGFITDGSLRIEHLYVVVAIPWLITAAYGFLILSNPMSYTRYDAYDEDGFPTGRSRHVDRMISLPLLAGPILGGLVENIRLKSVTRKIA